MLTGSTATDFAARIVRALEDAGRQGIRISAGSGADLELGQLTRVAPDEEDRATAGRPRHLEMPPGARDPGKAEGASRLCYFLDGVQGSREIGRIGTAPVVVATVAAAVVNRCERRLKRVDLGGPPGLVRAVILPRQAADEVEVFWGLLRDAGLDELREEIPSSDLVIDSTEYMGEVDPADYVGMKERALGRVRALRERLESELLNRWEGDDRVLDSDDWIAVDGQLRTRVEGPPPQRAVGLIKSVARPEFVGKDVGMLLDLAAGMRTTSFVPGWQLERAATDQRTSWYTRMWPPQRGADALGSLMRVEAPLDTTPEKVDEITRWILSERAPLAKPDSRWPAMIYPILHVEKVLKPLISGSERMYARLERQLITQQNGRN
jgi:hypothetical protein